MHVPEKAGLTASEAGPILDLSYLPCHLLGSGHPSVLLTGEVFDFAPSINGTLYNLHDAIAEPSTLRLRNRGDF